MTVAEFMAIPEDEPGHWELVEGEVVVNFPTGAHQRLTACTRWGATRR